MSGIGIILFIILVVTTAVSVTVGVEQWSEYRDTRDGFVAFLIVWAVALGMAVFFVVISIFWLFILHLFGLI